MYLRRRFTYSACVRDRNSIFNVILKPMQKVVPHILKNSPLDTRRNFPGSGTQRHDLNPELKNVTVNTPSLVFDTGKAGRRWRSILKFL